MGFLSSNKESRFISTMFLFVLIIAILFTSQSNASTPRVSYGENQSSEPISFLILDFVETTTTRLTGTVCFTILTVQMTGSSSPIFDGFNVVPSDPMLPLIARAPASGDLAYSYDPQGFRKYCVQINFDFVALNAKQIQLRYFGVGPFPFTAVLTSQDTNTETTFYGVTAPSYFQQRFPASTSVRVNSDGTSTALITIGNMGHMVDSQLWKTLAFEFKLADGTQVDIAQSITVYYESGMSYPTSYNKFIPGFWALSSPLSRQSIAIQMAVSFPTLDTGGDAFRTITLIPYVLPLGNPSIYFALDPIILNLEVPEIPNQITLENNITVPQQPFFNQAHFPSLGANVATGELQFTFTVKPLLTPVGLNPDYTFRVYPHWKHLRTLILIHCEPAPTSTTEALSIKSVGVGGWEIGFTYTAQTPPNDRFFQLACIGERVDIPAQTTQSGNNYDEVVDFYMELSYDDFTSNDNGVWVAPTWFKSQFPPRNQLLRTVFTKDYFGRLSLAPVRYGPAAVEGWNLQWTGPFLLPRQFATGLIYTACLTGPDQFSSVPSLNKVYYWGDRAVMPTEGIFPNPGYTTITNPSAGKTCHVLNWKTGTTSDLPGYVLLPDFLKFQYSITPTEIPSSSNNYAWSYTTKSKIYFDIELSGKQTFFYMQPLALPKFDLQPTAETPNFLNLTPNSQAQLSLQILSTPLNMPVLATGEQHAANQVWKNIRDVIIVAGSIVRFTFTCASTPSLSITLTGRDTSPLQWIPTTEKKVTLGSTDTISVATVLFNLGAIPNLIFDATFDFEISHPLTPTEFTSLGTQTIQLGRQLQFSDIGQTKFDFQTISPLVSLTVQSPPPAWTSSSVLYILQSYQFTATWTQTSTNTGAVFELWHFPQTNNEPETFSSTPVKLSSITATAPGTTFASNISILYGVKRAFIRGYYSTPYPDTHPSQFFDTQQFYLAPQCMKANSGASDTYSINSFESNCPASHFCSFSTGQCILNSGSDPNIQVTAEISNTGIGLDVVEIPLLVQNNNQQLQNPPYIIQNSDLTLTFTPSFDFDTVTVDICYYPSAYVGSGTTPQPIIVKTLDLDSTDNTISLTLSDFLSEHAHPNTFIKFTLHPSPDSTVSSDVTFNTVQFSILPRCLQPIPGATDLTNLEQFASSCTQPNPTCVSSTGLCHAPATPEQPDLTDIPTNCSQCDIDNTSTCGPAFSEPCECKTGFFGLICAETEECQPTSLTKCTSGHGYSVQTPTGCSNSCTCYNEWQGSRCQTCLINCNNGIAYNDCLRCGCSMGYTGNRCQCRSITASVTLNAINTFITLTQGKIASFTGNNDALVVDDEIATAYLNQLGASSDPSSKFKQLTFTEASFLDLMIDIFIDMQTPLIGNANGKFELSIVPVEVDTQQGKMGVKFSFSINFGCPEFNPTIQDLDQLTLQWGEFTTNFNKLPTIIKYFGRTNEELPKPEIEDPVQLPSTLPPTDERLPVNTALFNAYSLSFVFLVIFSLQTLTV